MNTIFEKKDFELCKVPVIQGYPQSQTHCSIGIDNRNYYLCTTPFPSRRKKYLIYVRAIIRRLSFNLLCNEQRAEFYENPCLYKAVIDKNNIPRNFIPMSLNPLMNTPDPCFGYPAFNSDPELLIKDHKIYILNRSTYRKENGYVNRLFLIEGEDENNWFKLLSIKMIKEESRAYMSPCLIRMRDKYIMTYLDTNSYNDGKTFRGLFLSTFEDIGQLPTIKDWKNIYIDIREYLPWHMSLFSYKDKLYTIIACTKKGEKNRCWQMIGEFSDDYNTLKIYNIPFTNYNSYRSSALVTEEGEFVLYNTIVNEYIKGSNSVDGRDILMAHMPFELLLNILNSEENNG